MSDSVHEGGGAARAAAHELESLVGRLSEEMAAFRRRALAAEARLKLLESELEDARAAVAAAEARQSAAPNEEPAPAASAASAASADGGGTSPVGADERARLAALQQENDELRARLDGAAGRTRQMLERLRFLRQQHSLGGPR